MNKILIVIIIILMIALYNIANIAQIELLQAIHWQLVDINNILNKWLTIDN